MWPETMEQLLEMVNHLAERRMVEKHWDADRGEWMFNIKPRHCPVCGGYAAYAAGQDGMPWNDTPCPGWYNCWPKLP